MSKYACLYLLLEELSFGRLLPFYKALKIPELQWDLEDSQLDFKKQQ